ncbi:MAG: hypothetical protein G3M78_03265 [Candidatus Nitrohelix vancouverensis]|uniref:Uncharacterized protein n=1 Tax=Candidatus Nitrohelix vancouverensis TaxID=2705534 RepID=A0A7T0C0W0_9BACT|nr:MAG: hypothetical protein G3M78_03265 [Candidatus Nitrohelix vancouverensis]
MHCPKCQREQEPSESCPYCGIVFAKFEEIQKRKQEALSAPPRSANEGTEDNTENLLKEAEGFFWRTAPMGVLAVLLGLFAFLMLWIAVHGVFSPDSILLALVHNVNLVFHEAGHMIFAIFGNDTLTILGGSLGQLLIPIIVAVAFFLRRDYPGFAFGVFWLFESLLDVALYMQDARELKLQLIGGLGMEAHDWRNLFNHWDLWRSDQLIVKIVRWVSWLGMLAICIDMARRVWKQRKENFI